MTHEQAEQLRVIARAALQRVTTPRHCGPGVPARCGCVWESGQWDVCDAHRKPHGEHTDAPWCDRCARDEAFMDHVRTCKGCLQYDEHGWLCNDGEALRDLADLDDCCDDIYTGRE